MPSWKTEEVLVVPRAQIFPDGAWHGFIDTDLDRYLDLAGCAGEARARAAALAPRDYTALVGWYLAVRTQPRA